MRCTFAPLQILNDLIAKAAAEHRLDAINPNLATLRASHL
jgi:hypothetical protein